MRITIPVLESNFGKKGNLRKYSEGGEREP